MSSPNEPYPMKSRHYDLIAASMAEAHTNLRTARQIEAITDYEAECAHGALLGASAIIARNLREDNPRVDVDRFIKATGAPSDLIDIFKKENLL